MIAFSSETKEKFLPQLKFSLKCAQRSLGLQRLELNIVTHIMDTLISLINTLYPLELRFSRNKKQIVTPTKIILSKKISWFWKLELLNCYQSMTSKYFPDEIVSCHFSTNFPQHWRLPPPSNTLNLLLLLIITVTNHKLVIRHFSGVGDASGILDNITFNKPDLYSLSLFYLKYVEKELHIEISYSQTFAKGCKNQSWYNHKEEWRQHKVCNEKTTT